MLATSSPRHVRPSPGMALARIEAAVRTIDALNAQVASTTEEQNQVGREC